MNEKKHVNRIKQMRDERREKINKLLSIKEKDLDIVLSSLTDKEKWIMIEWGLIQTLELKNHDKNKLFKWVYQEYHQLKTSQEFKENSKPYGK